MADFKYVLKKYYVVVALIMFLACITYANAQLCNSDEDCAKGLCCSKFGYCGSGFEYCSH